MSSTKPKVIVVKKNMPLLSILFIVFLVLKLTGHITWSWWLVTAPLWGPWAILLGAVGIGLLIAAPFAVFDARPKFTFRKRTPWK